MRPHALRSPFVLSLVLVFASGRAPSAQELWFATGQPELLESANPAANPQPLLTRQAHDDFVRRAQEANYSALVPLKRLPSGLSQSARIGFNLGVGDKNCGWVVDRTGPNAYVLYADSDADGDLTNARATPLTAQDGYLTTVVTVTVPEPAAGDGVARTSHTRIVIVPGSDGELRHRTHSTTVRRGTIQIGERSYTFRLFGQSGRYDRQSNRLWVDLNQDGQGDAESNSPEVLRATEERLSLAGRPYGFSVDPIGRSVTLRPLEGTLPERSSLRPATMAPEFSVSDIDGRPHSLRQYRGRVVLLDFWGTWCVPCQAEAPILRELQSTYGPSGLAIIGVAMDQADAVRTYVAQARHDWPQVVESAEGTLHRLYRVYGYPTKMLIGRDGKVVTSHSGGLLGNRAGFEQAIATAIRARP